MKFYSKLFSPFAMLLILVAGILIMAGTSIAGESPNLANKLIKYHGASVQAVSGSSGLWHQTTIDGKSGVWYYGDDSTMTYNVGGETSGTLNMSFDLTNVTSASLTLETKYQTESSVNYDKLKIMVGSDVLWERTQDESKNSAGNFGWETLNIPLTSYIGSKITITFSFDSIDGVSNDYFGWAIANVQAGSGTGTAIIPSSGSLVINQLDTGNFPSIDAYVTVTDANGQSVNGLTKSNFTVLEGNSLVTNFKVTPLNTGGQALSLGMMIDQSGSMSGSMTDAVDAVKQFINLGTGAQDQFGLVTIGSYASAALNGVLVLKNFTTNKAELLNAVSGLTATGMTPLYDGLAKTLELTAQQPGVKAVIAFTDGDDTQSSKYDVDSVIAYAKSLNIPIYTIGIGYADKTILTKIANQTGGTYTEATSAADLSQIYSQLMNVINQQYLINFTSLNPSLTVNSLGTMSAITTTPIAGASAITSTNQVCVKITATLPSSKTVSDISCYDKGNMPPNIALDQTTSGYLQNGPAAGNDLTIGAVITDPDQDTITNASLYYRIKSTTGASNTFTKLDMTLNPAVKGTYAAVIPGTDYTSAGIELYLTASDGIHTKTEPAASYYQIIPGSSGTVPGGGSNAQQIYILSPTNNETIGFGTTNGQVTFSWTKLTGVSKYVLNLQLTDILNGNVIPLPIDLIPASAGGTSNPWGGTSSAVSATPGLTETFLGMVYTLSLDQATWDVLSLYDIQWGIEAYDSSNNLIGSTFDSSSIPAKYVSKLKFLDSNAITMTSPDLGEVLSKTDSAPDFKWDTYQGVVSYTLILAHTGSLGFDKVISKDKLGLNVFPMDNATWQSMPTGTWYWTVLGYDASGNQTPKKFNIFDFIVQ